MGWFQKLKDGLSKTSSNITEGVTKIFTHQKLDAQVLEELEELLISSDLGVDTAASIITDLSKDKFDKEISTDEINKYLSDKISELIKPAEKEFTPKNTPHVVLMCGVNGNGKTTTIGKIASKYKVDGKKVLLVACDTFRAAAIEQLQVWADRVGTTLIKGELNSDPASVAYRGVEQAIKGGYDIVLIDTAGRLHNKSNLMDELSKINKVIKKVLPDAPHDTILTLDATTGQNAVMQVQTFKEIVDVSGLVITKLDGTAKGGILVSIVKKFKLPIYYIGIGEGIDDLNKFSAKEFSKALVL